MFLQASDIGVDLLYPFGAKGPQGPTPKQVIFRDDPNRHKLYGGAVGGGKTVALNAEGVRLSLAYPGNRGFLCRHEATAFKMTTLATLIKLISKIEEVIGNKILSNHHRTDKIFHFLNGSRLEYGALGEASDFERIKSLEVGWFGIDEASEASLPNYQMLKSRLRWQLPDGSYPPFFGLLASNPEPGWVKDIFVTPWKMGEPLPNHSFIQALPKDNPHLPPDYLDELRASNPGPWVEKYIEGSWDAMEGQVWPEYDFNTHVIKPFKIPYNWTRLRVIDHGQKNPTCCLWIAVDPDDNLFVYKEYYSPGVVSEHCKKIRSMSAGESYISTYLPPECWGKTLEKDSRLWSVQDEYAEHEIFCSQANNEVLAGINRVSEFLMMDPEAIHPLTGKKGSPSLFIFNTCRNLMLEIPDYIWVEQKGLISSVERPRKIKDHACDALRYGVMSRPSPTQLAEVIPFNSFMSIRGRMIKAKKMARRGMDKYDAFDMLNRRLH